MMLVILCIDRILTVVGASWGFPRAMVAAGYVSPLKKMKQNHLGGSQVIGNPLPPFMVVGWTWIHTWNFLTHPCMVWHVHPTSANVVASFVPCCLKIWIYTQWLAKNIGINLGISWDKFSFRILTIGDEKPSIMEVYDVYGDNCSAIEDIEIPVRPKLVGFHWKQSFLQDL